MAESVPNDDADLTATPSQYWEGRQLISRERLYALLWERPMTTLVASAPISNVGLAKICRKAGIPLPSRGYWAKLQSGKPVKRSLLPPRQLGQHDAVNVPAAILVAADDAFGAAHEPKEPQFEDIEDMKATLRQALGKVTVPKSLSKAHPEIRKLLDADERHRQKQLTEQFYFTKPRFDTPLDRRRLRIVNAMFIAAARAGGHSSCNRDDPIRPSIGFGGIPTRFSIERGAIKKGRLIPGETLHVVAESGFQKPPVIWEDQQEAPLETRLSEILVGLGVLAEERHREHVRWRFKLDREHRAEEIAAKEERVVQEGQARTEREAADIAARVNRLIDDAENMRKADNIRFYVATVHDRLAASVSSEKLDAWSTWARSLADSLDPIASGQIAKMIEVFGSEANIIDAGDGRE